MHYVSHYCSPLGNILLSADALNRLTGLWFEEQKYFAPHLDLDKEHKERETPLLEKVKQWLDLYFSGKEPDFAVPLHFRAPAFNKKSGKSCAPFPTVKPRHTAKLPSSLPPKEVSHI